MADKNSYPLSLLLRAVDGVTAPLQRINAQIEKVTGPATVAGNALASLGKAGGFEQLREAAGAVLTNIRNVGSEAAALGKKVAVGLGVAGFASYEFIQRAVESGAALKFQSQRLGVSVDELSSYGFAAKEAGVNQEEFSTGLDYFNRILGQTKAGRGRLRPLLQGVTGGASVLKQLESANGTGAALGVLVQRLNELPDANNRAALAGAAFGPGAKEMLNFALLGSTRIRLLREEFLRTAGSQEEFADGSKRVVQAEALLDAAWTGTRNTLLVPLFPVLREQLAKLTGYLVDHRQEIRAWAQDGAQAVGEFAGSLPGRIQSFIAFTRRVRAALQPVADLVGGWPTLFATVGAGILAGPLIGAIAQLTASVVMLGGAIVLTPFGWVIGGLAALGIAVLAVTGHYNDMIAAADRAMHPPAARPIHGPAPYTLDEAQQKLFELNQQPNASAFSTRVPLIVDDSGLTGRPSIVPNAFTPPQAPRSPLTVEGNPFADRETPAGTPGAAGTITIDFKNAPRGTKITKSPGIADSIALSLGYAMGDR